MRIRIAVLTLLLCAAAAIMAAPQGTAPHDPQLIDARGYEKILAEHRGKPLLINFWATYCEPCRDEYPLINELAKKYAPNGLQVVGINFDDDGDLILMRRFLNRYKPIFPNYRKKHGGDSEFTLAALPQWNGSLPVSLFYDRDGRQITHFIGAGNRETFEAAIRQLVGASGAAGSGH